MANDRILSRALQDEMAGVPLEGYGVKRVVVRLEDGTEYPGVRVAWNKEVVGVMNHDGVPFEVATIDSVRHDPYLEQQEEGDAF